MYICSAKKLLTMGIIARYSTDPILRICASHVIMPERHSADEIDHRVSSGLTSSSVSAVASASGSSAIGSAGAGAAFSSVGASA